MDQGRNMFQQTLTVYLDQDNQKVFYVVMEYLY